jgi:hypothetical protein
MYIIDRIAAGSPNGGFKFVAGELSMHQNVGIQSPVVYKYLRAPFDEGLNAFTATGCEADKKV